VNQGVYIEPVPPVGYRNTHAPAERGGCNSVRQLKHGFAPVQETELAGRKSELPGKQRVRLNCFRC
jgi:hypothetical protein